MFSYIKGILGGDGGDEDLKNEKAGEDEKAQDGNTPVENSSVTEAMRKDEVILCP